MINKLYTLLKDRKKDLPNGSYAARLFKQGKDRICQKIGEEATEVIIAAKNPNKKRVVEEVADLTFFILVLMVELNLDLKNIKQELEERGLNKN